MTLREELEGLVAWLRSAPERGDGSELWLRVSLVADLLQLTLDRHPPDEPRAAGNEAEEP